MFLFLITSTRRWKFQEAHTSAVFQEVNFVTCLLGREFAFGKFAPVRTCRKTMNWRTARVSDSVSSGSEILVRYILQQRVSSNSTLHYTCASTLCTYPVMKIIRLIDTKSYVCRPNERYNMRLFLLWNLPIVSYSNKNTNSRKNIA